MTRPGPYAGKVVVLTGASAGIGHALARELAPQGPRLVLAARDVARLEAVAAECRHLGAEALVVPTDVGVEADCRRLVARTVETWGRLDVLLLNAGMTMWARCEDLTDLAVYEQLMRVNYLGSVWATHAALPHLRRSVGGQIVVVASLAGMTGVPTRSGYAASKHAQFGFFDSLRIELEGSGVAVTMVAPDFVRSEIHARAIGADGKPLGTSPFADRKIMSAEECARLTVRAMTRRQRLAILSLRGRFGRWLRLLAPSVIDGMARRAIAAARPPSSVA